MSGPTLTIDLQKLTANARLLVGRCAAAGLSVMAVTKATCGAPQVARALLAGGATSIGESRIENVQRLRRGGIVAPVTMLRIPSVSEAAAVVEWCDASLNSEAAVIDALSQAAVEAGRVHDVVVMVELGDRREGAAVDDVGPLAERVAALPGLRLAGLGTNFMCASGVYPSLKALDLLARTVEDVEARCGFRLSVVSGGNSSLLPLLDTARLPARIDNVRLGASLLIGENSWTGGPLPGLATDAFLLEAEVVEVKVKPSLPEGETGRDAFGERRSFVDRGPRRRAIVNLGRLDIDPAGLRPHEAGIEVVTASSDHLILDVTETAETGDGAVIGAVGSRIAFEMDYAALVRGMLSPYVAKTVLVAGGGAAPERRVEALMPADITAAAATEAFAETLAEMGYAAAITPLADAPESEAAIVAALGARAVPLLVVADRTGLSPLFAALAAGGARLGLLWLDARASADPDDAGEAGVLARALAGGAVAMPEATVLVGLQGASRAEQRFVRDHQLLALTMEDVDLLGVREVMRRAIGKASEATDGIVLVLHASAAKGMGAASGDSGLSYRECSLAMEMAAASGHLAALALTGLGDRPSPAAADAAFGYLASALGKRILGA
ncbi:alanine racemase [Methylobrevis albus]|uniref:Alanine racemase n=1 Tax=Methylobrevis albus TaxID=2793297 RepID=A0A931MYS8_9HYPH|nr:alanine racemase [Methylobrevis albus]MBH0238762.1 alanine racemase [Methylobrevis albus]